MSLMIFTFNAACLFSIIVLFLTDVCSGEELLPTSLEPV